MIRSLKTRRLIPIASLLSIGFLLADTTESHGQSLFEQIGKQVEREIRNNLQRGRDNPQNPAEPPKAQIQSAIPDESGSKNNKGGSFNPGDFFQPQRPPRTNPPRTNPPRTNPPQTYPPRTRPPQTLPPRNTYPPQNTIPPRRTDLSFLKLKIRSPSSMDRNVSYWLESGGSRYDFVMKPGHAQTLTESREWLIHFRQFGKEMVYRLRGGKLYEFDQDAQGRLQLYMSGDFVDTPKTPEPPRRSFNSGR